MRPAEITLVAGIMLGIWCKLMHWPGGALLIVCSGCGLGLYYFPFGIRTLAAPKRTDRILWLSLVAGAALCAALVGVIGCMHLWPVWPTLAAGGAIACTLVLPVAASFRPRHRHLDIYLDGLLLRCLVIGALAAVMFAFYA